MKRGVGVRTRCSRPEAAATNRVGAGASPEVGLRSACAAEVDEVAAQFGSGTDGLGEAAVIAQRARFGPNVLRRHEVRPAQVLVRQFDSPLLILLLVAAAVSAGIGQGTEAVLIAVIVGSSAMLGFTNEVRAERAAASLQLRIQQRVGVRRNGVWSDVPLIDLVPGDVVRLTLGSIVPADLRLTKANSLECDESVLTGESVPVGKSTLRVRNQPTADPFSCGLHMGTVVRRGDAEGIVVATAGSTEFGRVALALGTRRAATEFEKGLRRYSVLLTKVAVALAAFVFATNLVRGRAVVEAALFSLAVAVGITPELLPVIVTTSMASGARRLASQNVLVKRLVCIEDLGDISVLLTDKTGTLTEGAVGFSHAVTVSELSTDDVVEIASLGVRGGGEGGTGGSIDSAILDAAGRHSRRLGDLACLADVPFDHDRRVSSVLVADSGGRRWIITKGAPEAVVAMCRPVGAGAVALSETEFRSGSRLLAVAWRELTGATPFTIAEERDLTLLGFVAFEDPPKASAAGSIARLVALGIEVKVATGDNMIVAERVCRQLGMPVKGTVCGPDIDACNDTDIVELATTNTIFARVNPEQKARILRALRTQGKGVAFLGDGVNDAIALHAADVGISVDTAADVARDAADVVLLQKDLGVLADGVVEGRRIFANTMKYVLIGTSSAFGNMISAAAASVFLSFLPMLPVQILLNNLLYESSQTTIPTDFVDDEQLRRPAQWDLRLIRRFMATFGPLSSIFDIVTFVVMIRVFHSSQDQFRSGWFTESLVTQTAVIFVIRTRRFPFFRSTPSRPVIASTLLCIAAAVAIPLSPIRSVFGFVPPRPRYFVVLGLLAFAYLALVDLLKSRIRGEPVVIAESSVPLVARMERRAAHWSYAGPSAVAPASNSGDRPAHVPHNPLEVHARRRHR